MTDQRIHFSAPMVRAILRQIEAPGTGKTQTRRMMPHQDALATAYSPIVSGIRIFNYAGEEEISRSRCSVGDRLWVREEWRTFVSLDDVPPRDLWAPGGERGAGVLYEADGSGMSLTADCERVYVSQEIRPAFGKKRMARYMPRWASRLTLYVTGVRVQRLQDITEEDAWAEGCLRGLRDDVGGFFPAEEPHPSGVGLVGWDTARGWYADRWDRIKGPGSWDANPWVAAYTFVPIWGNISVLGTLIEETSLCA